MECKTCGKQQPLDSNIKGSASRILTERYLFLPEGISVILKLVYDQLLDDEDNEYIVVAVNWKHGKGSNVTIITPPDGGMIG